MVAQRQHAAPPPFAPPIPTHPHPPKAVGELPPRHKQLKPLHHAGAAPVRLGQRRDLEGVVGHKGGLLQACLHQAFKHLVQHVAHCSMRSTAQWSIGSGCALVLIGWVGSKGSWCGRCCKTEGDDGAPWGESEGTQARLGAGACMRLGIAGHAHPTGRPARPAARRKCRQAAPAAPPPPPHAPPAAAAGSRQSENSRSGASPSHPLTSLHGAPCPHLHICAAKLLKVDAARVPHEVMHRRPAEGRLKVQRLPLVRELQAAGHGLLDSARTQASGAQEGAHGGTPSANQASIQLHAAACHHPAQPTRAARCTR